MQASKTALLIMDVQPSIVASVQDQEAYVDQVNQTAIAARQKNIPIFFVVVGFRPGFPEVGGHNKMFGSIKEQGATGMIEPSPVIAPTEKDLVITKRRVSAFTGSDLEVILRGQGITHLVLCGIATSGVVLSTTREAADKDYGITILSDLCRDRDEEVHRVLIEKVFPRQADVTTAGEWLGTLPS
jgi:nicotinamidase-related amidase